MCPFAALRSRRPDSYALFRALRDSRPKGNNECRSSRCRYTLPRQGEITPRCGVPVTSPICYASTQMLKKLPSSLPPPYTIMRREASS